MNEMYLFLFSFFRIALHLCTIQYSMNNSRPPTSCQDNCDNRDSSGLWKCRFHHTINEQTSSDPPISRILPFEKSALHASHDWEVFAAHSAAVRPTTDVEWDAGRACDVRKGTIELPPGAQPFVTSGQCIRHYDPFVYPNPPRHTIAECPGAKATQPLLWRKDMEDFERMVWFHDEPRKERAFRLYADVRSCTRLGDSSKLFRTGW